MLNTKSHTFLKISPLLQVGTVICVFVNFSAYADVDCPGRISLDKPRKTMTDTVGPIPLDKSIIIEYRNMLYRIPVGYLSVWPSTKGPTGIDPDKVQRPESHDSESLDFAFWMPSLRYPERNPMFTPSFRPCENGRPPATPDQEEYIVQVRVEPLPSMAGGGGLTPSQKFKNSITNTYKGSGEQAFNFTKEYDLLRYDHKVIPNPKRYSYRHLKNTEPEVLFHCAEPPANLPNPSCHGYVYFPDKDLHFYIRFSTQDLPHWREMLSATQTLLDRWQIKNPNEANQITDKE